MVDEMLVNDGPGLIDIKSSNIGGDDRDCGELKYESLDRCRRDRIRGKENAQTPRNVAEKEV